MNTSPTQSQLLPSPAHHLRIRLGFATVCAAIALLSVSPTALAYDFTIDGHFLCKNGPIAPMPVAGARVEFWHNYIGGTTDFDTTQVSPRTHTDANGFYHSGNIHGDDVTNYYAKLVLDDDAAVPGGSAGARLHDFYTNGSQYYLSPLADDSKGNAHFDRILNQDLGASAPECAIWQGAHNAYQEYTQTTGGLPPSADYDIKVEIATGTPWTTLSTTHWPYNSQAHPPWSVNFHEFAHSVRHTLDGDEGHFYSDAATYIYARNHNGCSETNHGFAFNEGWAEYWGGWWGPAPACAGEIYNPLNTEREGVVAIALKRLAECQLNGKSVGRAGLVGVLHDNRGAIHSIQEFFAAFQRKYPGLPADMLNGCASSQQSPLSTGLGPKSVDGRFFKVLLDRVSRRKQLLVRDMASSRADLPLALRCREPKCFSKAYEIVVKPYALQSELERTLLLEKLITRTARESLSSRVQYDKAADDTAIPTEFDKANATIVVSFAKRALEAVIPLVRQDRSGALAKKSLELTGRVKELEAFVQGDSSHIDMPRISLAEEKAFPAPLADAPP